jgi:hypothetical protein
MASRAFGIGKGQMAMVITSRARLLTLCAMLTLPPPGGALADPAIKPAITGLISTGSPTNTLDEFADRLGIFGGVVVQATWADFQPQSSSDFITTVVDKALATVRNYNAILTTATPPNNRQLGVRLRVFAGCSGGVSDAPGWAMNLDGGPIPITAEYNSVPTACKFGRFWDPASGYAAAWQQFQVMLAAKYDTHPLIQEVAVTSCTSYSAEPFFLNLKPAVEPPGAPIPPSPTSSLQTAGYTDAAYQQCLAQAIANDYAPWKSTRLEFSFNPFSGVNTPPQGDIAFSERVMRGCRQAVGPRCILSNHDLDAKTPSTILPIYALERKFGPNITFQSLFTNPTDFEGTIRKGISLGAGAIEVWPKGFKTESNTTLGTWAAMFAPQ